MRTTAAKLALAALVFGVSCAGTAWGKFSGLSLSTPYPDQTVQAGEPVVIALTVHNYDLPPQVVALEAQQVARGWRAQFEGDARTVHAVFVAPGRSQSVSVHLTPPADVTSGTFRFLLRAQGSGETAQLPITLHLAKTLPDWLALRADLPTLQGSPSTDFSYDLKLRNRSGRDVMVNLSADAPQGFEVNFSPEFGSENVTAVPVKAGATKSVTAKVSLPDRAPAGTYPLKVAAAAGGARAELPLTLVVSGRPRLSLGTPDEVLSGTAYVEHPSTVALLLRNTGSAPARSVALSADSPSHWRVKFEPQRIPALGPHQSERVSATITPAERSLAGDYMVTFDANSADASAHANYRVTVLTSTLWGVVGIALAAVAILVVGFAVMRFGRR
ncbi:MAG: NEW3 domain-containing protein [Betaproteobacteria bacterium]|nr:NEW3 domain-containing protein [Betaproteobacteria bacterium]